MAIKIRDEEPIERESVYDAVRSAFARIDEAELVERLRDDGSTVISLVAEENGEIVGHVLLSKMEAPFPALALAPVSVVPTQHRRGIGSYLIDVAVTRARSQGWAAIFVLGEPDYYRRFGFNTEAANGFTSPYSGRNFMVLKLLPSLPTSEGELRHAPAFAALGQLPPNAKSL